MTTILPTFLLVCAVVVLVAVDLARDARYGTMRNHFPGIRKMVNRFGAGAWRNKTQGNENADPERILQTRTTKRSPAFQAGWCRVKFSAAPRTIPPHIRREILAKIIERIK